ncbi:transmembrane protein 186 [Gadus morhua]|uniref:Transmembrane protein 186 n=1 Tax=Gadus morhua TaxID=8049 RepID=A0A8C4ZV67_GADMO|nr:transmembrane protein 186 [Gadus morhua]
MLSARFASRLSSHLRCCNRVPCLISTPRHPLVQLGGPQLLYSTRQPGQTYSMQHGFLRPHLQVTRLANYSDLSTERYSMIYHLPHIKLIRAISRLKLLQTGITLAILPPVYYFYLSGELSYFLATYSTGIAVLAGVMLYTASHFLRKVVGMMYLDSTQSTLKVSHLTFWGRRHDVFLPVTDVMTLGDTGDALTETVLRLKRYSTAETMYFSLSYGRIVDKQAFEKVFGPLK